MCNPVRTVSSLWDENLFFTIVFTPLMHMLWKSQANGTCLTDSGRLAPTAATIEQLFRPHSAAPVIILTGTDNERSFQIMLTKQQHYLSPWSIIQTFLIHSANYNVQADNGRTRRIFFFFAVHLPDHTEFCEWSLSWTVSTSSVTSSGGTWPFPWRWVAGPVTWALWTRRHRPRRLPMWPPLPVH